MKNKKVLVLGAGPEHSAVFNKELSDHKLTFETSSSAALRRAKSADVIAVHIDKHGGFLDEVINLGYSGGIVAIATSKRTINKLLKFPNGVIVDPVSWGTAPHAIMRALAT